MCISAPASIAAGGLLTAIGIANLKQVRKPGQSLFAAIPLLFAAQQFSEAFVWLSLQSPEYSGFKTTAALVFLAFAQIIWPVYVPLSLYFMENDPGRKKRILIFAMTGLAFSAYMAYCLLFFEVDAEISQQHIRYSMFYPLKLGNVGGLAYFMATVASLFITGIPRMKILGLAILASFLLSKLYFADTLISVWCFFAALQSMLVYYILFGFRKPSLLSNPLA